MWKYRHSALFRATASQHELDNIPGRNIKRSFGFLTSERCIVEQGPYFSLLYQRNITPALARFMADHTIKFCSSNKQSVLHQALANTSVYITVADLTTILFALLIATVVFNISELCLKWGGRAVAGSLGLSSWWSCSLTVAHKHSPVFSFPRGKAVFTRLSSSLADMASITRSMTP